MAVPRDITILAEQVQELVQKVDSLRTANGWKESASMVLAELKRQGEVQEQHEVRLRDMQKEITDRLSAIQIALVTAQTETHGKIGLVEEKMSSVAASIGSSPPCKEHSRALTKLSERVDQHASQHKERFAYVESNRSEIEKLRDWVKKVNDAGLVDATRGEVRWGTVGLVSALGGAGSWGIAELLIMLLRRLGA